MKTICILTLGSRGDVQPYIPLAKGLQRAGYSVALCTSPEFEALVTGQGVSFRPVRAGYLALASSDEGRAMLAGNVFATIKSMKTLITPMIRQSLQDMAQVCGDAGAILCHPKAFGAYDIAQGRHIPLVTAVPTPVVEPVAAFANPAFFSRSFGAFLNKKSYGLNRLGTASFTGAIRAWRRDTLGLPAKRPGHIDSQWNRTRIPVLYGISPSVLPDVPETPRFCVSGYWFMDQPAYTPDAQLAAFTENEKVVCIGFGSMGVQQPHRFNQMLLDTAASLAPQKIVVLSGWNGFDEKTALPANVLVRKNVPHDWLFPKASLVVHHGGAGTTAACLRAGTPMVICPLTGDQPFWAAQMRKLGVLPDSLPIQKATSHKLSAMVRLALGNPRLAGNASALSQRIAQEDGVGKAVRFLTSQWDQMEQQPSAE